MLEILKLNNYPWTRLTVRIIGVIKRQLFHTVTHVFDSSNLSQEIFAIDTWGAVICSLGHGRKHMLTILPTIWSPRVAEHACDDASKRILMPSAYRLQIFLVRDQYLRSLLSHGDQAKAGQVEKHVLKPMLAILTTHMETRLKAQGWFGKWLVRIITGVAVDHITLLIVNLVCIYACACF